METRAQKARAIALEMGWLAAALSVVNLVLEGQAMPLWQWLLVPPTSFVLFFLLAFPLAFAFPGLAEGRERTDVERRRRFARIRPYLGPGAVIVFGLLLWLVLWLVNVFTRAV
jgi:hypothetical protein